MRQNANRDVKLQCNKTRSVTAITQSHHSPDREKSPTFQDEIAGNMSNQKMCIY